MNKQNVQKLALFLTGLEQRFEDNKEYFIKLSAIFKSGLRDFPAEIVYDRGKLRMNYNGNIEVLEPTWLSARLSKIAETYDDVLVTYLERGTTLVIEADNRNVRMTTKRIGGEEGSASHSEASQLGNRDYFIKIGQADSLLKEIGILGSNGKIKNDMIRKYNQIDHYVELIDDILKELSERHESITVLDCGCGKSYLTFVLNFYIREVLRKPCHFIGLDYSSQVVEASRGIASRLGYANMEFRATDIRDYTANRDIHLAISLHACDTATDEAIALAVRNNVKAMVMVPCCHRELLSQYSYKPFEQVLKHGIFKARMADVLTDGLRALMLESLGYKVSVVEYVSPLDTPKNLMIRAQKVQGMNKKALEEYRTLKNLLNAGTTLEKLVNTGM